MTADDAKLAAGQFKTFVQDHGEVEGPGEREGWIGKRLTFEVNACNGWLFGEMKGWEHEITADAV